MAATHACLLAALAVLLSASPAAAFCAYNTGSSPVTFMTWPVSGQTFKKVVQPGQSACCNFNQNTCTAAAEGQDGPNPTTQCQGIQMYMTAQSLNTNQITSNFITQEVVSYLQPLLEIIGVGAKLIPEVGQIVSAVDAFAKAGLDIASAAAQTNIPFQSGDQFATLAAVGRQQ
ncbi:hypothetical protein WJX73_004941 [Symbiochloris irregularis]|uniref:Uncharacterized protein n=1 Tax=Symbiochloris irregularis TaxID=706552 RepID=A0AAW1NJG9_9CHLO